MNAKQFAEEFINDLPDTLTHIDIDDSNFIFNNDIYIDDPNLKVLKSKLNKIGFDLELVQEADKKYEQRWKLIKI